MSRISLKDRIVFITGASSGIGEATAKAFAAEGARLILTARRKDRLDKLAASLGVPCLTLKLDVTDRKAVEAAVQGLPAEWQAIDVLVNNAGLAKGASKYQDYSLDDVDEMIDANIKGVMYCTRLIMPGMIARNRGHIINMGSVAGHYAYQNGTVYCATKAAVKSMTEALKQDLLGSVVRFNGDAERASKVYEGVKPMSGDDIAEMIVFAATRPEHININFMVIMSVYQSLPTTVHRTGIPGLTS
jgi:serine 3-dehydrogenase